MRDLNPYICNRWASLRNTTQPILEGTDIQTFQSIVQGDKRFVDNSVLGFGVHGGGHYVVSK